MAARKNTARSARIPLVLPVPSADPRRDFCRAFGAALKSHRERAGMSQEQLANAAEIDHSYPSMLERGMRSPTVLVLYRLAGALGVTVPEFLQTVEVLQAKR